MTNIPSLRSSIEYLLADPAEVDILTIGEVPQESLPVMNDLRVWEKPTVGYTLQTFSVLFFLDPARLEGLASFRARAFVWVKGSAGVYAPLSHQPGTLLVPKVGLFRLGPDVHGGDASFAAFADPYEIVVSLPAALKVFKVQVVPYNGFDPFAVPTPEGGGGIES